MAIRRDRLFFSSYLGKKPELRSELTFGFSGWSPV